MAQETATPETAGDCLTYTVPEAGRLVGLTRNKAYLAAARGELPVIRFGKLLKVPKEAFHKMLDRSAKAS